MSTITKSIAATICKDPRLAGHVFCGPISNSAQITLEYLDRELDELDKSLSVVEFAAEYGQYAHKIRNLRDNLGNIKSGISKADSIVSLFDDAKSLVNGIRRIREFDPATDPIGTAKAYGAVMQSLGKLAQNLPSPGREVGMIIAEMGKIFAKVVTDIVPHTRPVVDRANKKWAVSPGDEKPFDIP